MSLQPQVRSPKLPTRLSPSAADTWINCPKKWWGKYIFGVVDPPGPAAELGTLVHAALEDIYNAPPESRNRQTANRSIRARAQQMTLDGAFIDVDDPLAFFREAWTRLLTIWKVEDPERVDVVATEQKLHTEVAGVPFTGIIDRLERINNKVVVGDYKTGKRDMRYRESKDRQLQLYVSAVNNAMDVKAEGARLIWLSTSGFIDDVPSSPDDISRTEETFAGVWGELKESVKTDTWEERPSPLCGWCPVLSMCESGKSQVRHMASEGRLKDHATAWSIKDQWQ